MDSSMIDTMVALSKEKNELLLEILQLTKLQKDLIEKEDMEELNYVLDKKDKIMLEIDKIDVSFLTLYGQLKREENIDSLDEINTDKYPNLKDLKEVVAEVTSTLMSISLLDEKNNKSIRESLEKTKLELRRVKKGKIAYKGYNTEVSGSMLIDEKK
ncbi:flagellar protein FlgN [Tissierella sp. MSJ-40]|uniref:Flagellar protein FlgN n=1 Tax=Tissierella simiarum TaxID=2841534 RepID=A0ABS6E129_9FIRM|nr:flagellar export chaperone FlgN [Tissierella simiarum]MBU5436597.1 flagellar protein FlgN [Tissierella simiarum]